MNIADTIAQFITGVTSDLFEAAASISASLVNPMAALLGSAPGPEVK